MQEHQIQEDPTCHRATKPMPHNDQAHTLKLLKPTHPRACAPQQEKPQQWKARTLQQRVAPARQLKKACV